MSNRPGADVHVVGMEELRTIMAGLADKLQLKYMDAAVKAASKVVIKEAQTRLRAQQKPRETKRANQIKEKRMIPLWKTIASVIRKKRRRRKTVGVVGPRYPEGAQGHLVERGHVMFAWGKATGKRVQAYPFLGPALEAKRAEVNAIIRGKVQSFVTEAKK